MQRTVCVLICLNLLLAGYLGAALYRRSGSAHQVQTEDLIPGPDPAGAPAVTGRRGSAAKTSPENFNWDSLASTDLTRYAANLRKAGCPEQPIKDIMLAEINRLYAPREIALKVRPDDIAPWEKPGTYSRYSGETKLRQLLEEKRGLLKELAGVDTGIEMPKRLAGRDQEKFEVAFNGIPDSKRDQVRAIQENYWAQSDDIKQRTMGYLEPEDRDEFQRIKKERRDALANVLSPRELEDYEMSTSDATSKLRSRLQSVSVNDDEFRKIFNLVEPLDEQYSLSRKNPDPLDQEFTAARTQAEKDAEQSIHSVLGDDRFAEYERSKDPAYKAISKAGADAGLSQESILQAYNTQREMRDASQRILADQSLTQEQRLQSLTEMRAQAAQQFQQLFGEKGAKLLQRLPDVRIAERYGLIVPPLPTDAPNSRTVEIVTKP